MQDNDLIEVSRDSIEFPLPPLSGIEEYIRHQLDVWREEKLYIEVSVYRPDGGRELFQLGTKNAGQ